MSQKNIQFDSAVRERKTKKRPSNVGNIAASQNRGATLFSRAGRRRAFFTEDSGRYLTHAQLLSLEQGLRPRLAKGRWDSVQSRIEREYVRHVPSGSDKLTRALEEYRSRIVEYKQGLSQKAEGIKGLGDALVQSFSLVRLWHASMVGAILLGMFSMTLIYRYLGQGASAGNVSGGEPIQAIEQRLVAVDPKAQEEAEIFAQKVIENAQQASEESFAKELREMVKGYPIEDMVPYIAQKDRTVAAFLVSIAKKESNWGKRRPVLNGQDCYNYWGYRGQRKLMGTGGHTCFNSRKDAVDTVAKRIEFLVSNKKLDTPAKMIVWKCGSTCAGHDDYGVRKWISDVQMYFEKFDE